MKEKGRRRKKEDRGRKSIIMIIGGDSFLPCINGIRMIVIFLLLSCTGFIECNPRSTRIQELVPNLIRIHGREFEGEKVFDDKEKIFDDKERILEKKLNENVSKSSSTNVPTSDLNRLSNHWNQVKKLFLESSSFQSTIRKDANFQTFHHHSNLHHSLPSSSFSSPSSSPSRSLLSLSSSSSFINNSSNHTSGNQAQEIQGKMKEIQQKMKEIKQVSKDEKNKGKNQERSEGKERKEEEMMMKDSNKMEFVQFLTLNVMNETSNNNHNHHDGKSGSKGNEKTSENKENRNKRNERIDEKSEDEKMKNDPWYLNWDRIPYPGSGYTQLGLVLLAFFITCIMILIVIGNLLVCIAIGTERSLKTVQNWFIASLAISDLGLGLVIMPFSLAYELMGYWTFGDIWCEVSSTI